MPHSALSRAAATMVTLVSLVGATLAAPSALAADGGDRKVASETSAKKASRALDRAQTALAGKGGDATMALRDLWLQRDNLSTSDRATYAKLAGRPSKPETMAAGNIRIHYNSAEMPAFSPTDVLNTSVSISQLYSASGYRTPLPDGALGGDALTDIYVDTLPNGLYGYCTTDQQKQTGPGRFDVWAYCVVDNDYAGFPLTPLQNLQVTVAHEYFHATQFAYDIGEDTWWMEGTAAWVEDQAYDAVNDNVQYLADSPITDRKRSMDKSGGLYHYGTWIFFRYLTEKYPATVGFLPKVLLDFWNAADSSQGAKKDKYSTQAIDSVLKKKPYKTSLAEEFALFSDANRRPAAIYEEGAANNYPSAKINGKKALKKGQAKAFTAKLDHLSAAAYQFTPKSNAKKLKLAISGAPKAQGTRAVVTTYLVDGSTKTKYVKISSRGKGSFKSSFKKSKVAAVEVTLVNASTRYTNCYPPPNQYSAFACGGRPLDQDRRITVLAKAV